MALDIGWAVMAEGLEGYVDSINFLSQWFRTIDCADCTKVELIGVCESDCHRLQSCLSSGAETHFWSRLTSKTRPLCSKLGPRWKNFSKKVLETFLVESCLVSALEGLVLSRIRPLLEISPKKRRSLVLPNFHWVPAQTKS